MTDVISSLSYEPERWVVSHRYFLQKDGCNIFVRCFKRWRWSLISRNDKGEVIGYHPTSIMQSIAIYNLIRKGIKHEYTREGIERYGRSTY